MTRSKRFLLPSLLSAIAGLDVGTRVGQHEMKVVSPIFSEISGKLGGAVGMTSRFGMQLRSLVTPSNPETPAQFIVRGIVSSLTFAWQRELSQTQRGGWENLADDTPGGNSGFNLFIKSNMPHMRAMQLPVPLAGVTKVLDAPDFLSTEFPAPSAVVVDASAGTIAFTLPPTDTYDFQDAGGGVLVSVTREQPDTRNTRIHPYALWGGKKGVDAFGALTLAKPASVALVAGRAVYVSFASFTAGGQVGPVNVQRITIQA